MSSIQNYPSNQFPLKISEFKSALESKDKEDIVGYACRSTGCPIARVLKKDFGGGDVYVNKRGTSFKGDNYENPQWVKEFLHQIDGCKEVNDPITVEEALEVVNNFLYCTKCNQDNPKGTNCGKDNCPW